MNRIHVGIIMDGNGRWAASRGKPRTAGHVAGARKVREIVESAPSSGIGTLTLYAFSADNWSRPQREISALMKLFRRYLVSEVDRCLNNDVRMTVIGRRDRLPAELVRTIEGAEEATRHCRTLNLRIALDYSSRDSILRATQFVDKKGQLSREDFVKAIAFVNHDTTSSPDVDLLIRTGGEQRLSDFLLWECAYAELYFTRRMWPDFTPADLADAVREFHSRERRFGGIVPAVAAG